MGFFNYYVVGVGVEGLCFEIYRMAPKTTKTFGLMSRFHILTVVCHHLKRKLSGSDLKCVAATT